MDSVVMGQPVHPRVRGEQTGMLRVMYSGSGSSPRARGTVHKPNSPPALARFIPACAGNRRAGSRACGRWPVHPRVRGEQTEGGCMEYRGYGSSPRARGIGPARPGRRAGCRFIPACAGNSAATTSTACTTPVHPRVRGEQRETYDGAELRPGSSPRARGTVAACAPKRAPARFIPACAGNRATSSAVTLRGSVHPRVRGEQKEHALIAARHIGSSPRARGTVATATRAPTSSRFIPACAGNSSQPARGTAWLPVHPRVRGEQVIGVTSSNVSGGSSPRARGTVLKQLWVHPAHRFIPACAGNRIQLKKLTAPLPVHPRVRGEQSTSYPFDGDETGSSPRARGTEVNALAWNRVARFIPACAGNRW